MSFTRIQHLISYANLTPDALGQLRTEMDAMLQEVYLFEENMKPQLVETEANLKQPIFDKVNSTIAEVAEERGLQYIFDQGTDAILFAEESTDVTSLVKLKI